MPADRSRAIRYMPYSSQMSIPEGPSPKKRSQKRSVMGHGVAEELEVRKAKYKASRPLGFLSTFTTPSERPTSSTPGPCVEADQAAPGEFLDFGLEDADYQDTTQPPLNFPNNSSSSERKEPKEDLADEETELTWERLLPSLEESYDHWVSMTQNGFIDPPLHRERLPCDCPNPQLHSRRIRLFYFDRAYP